MNLTMSEVRELIGGTTAAQATSGPCESPRRQIVVGERGWVFVGTVTRIGGDYVLADASVIRVWGTTNGLGELAIKGKQSKTILDPCGTVRIPELAVIARIDVAPGVSL